MIDNALWWDALLSHATDPLQFLLLAMANGLALDPMQQVVNVHWTGGLAVEFFNGSS